MPNLIGSRATCPIFSINEKYFTRQNLAIFRYGELIWKS